MHRKYLTSVLFHHYSGFLEDFECRYIIATRRDNTRRATLFFCASGRPFLQTETCEGGGVASGTHCADTSRPDIRQRYRIHEKHSTGGSRSMCTIPCCYKSERTRSGSVPMTKAPTPTEKSKKHRDNIKNATKTSITQRLRTDLGRSVGVTAVNPTGVVKRVLWAPTFPLTTSALWSTGHSKTENSFTIQTDFHKDWYICKF